MTTQTIAITGATGQFGAIALDLLKAQNVKTIALVRSPQKITEVENKVEARAFDYSQPAGQVEALQGVDTLILVSGNEIGQRTQQHRNVIQAAKQAGVKRIVYTSLLGADRENSVKSLAGEHLETEQLLKQSGVAYSILRNAWYSENYTDSIGSALELGAFYGSTKLQQISTALRAELAEAAVKVALQQGHENQTYELAGSTSYNLGDLAAEISQQTGKQIPYVDIPAADYAKALTEAGVPADFAALIAEWDEDAAKGALYSEDKTLEKLLGRPTASLATAVKLALEK